MAWLYAKSATWRKMVAFSAQGPLHFAAFTGVVVGVPLYLGVRVMTATNPEEDLAREQQLRQRASLHNQVTARANKERLAVLLGEVQSHKAGDERYAAALRGETLGTHSSRGSSQGAVYIKKDDDEPTGGGGS